MTILITNIKELVQVENSPKIMVCGEDMKLLPTLKNAFLLVENDLIKDFGEMSELPPFKVDKTIDAKGKILLPTWCDSHTHIVYAGNINSFINTELRQFIHFAKIYNKIIFYQKNAGIHP